MSTKEMIRKGILHLRETLESFLQHSLPLIEDQPYVLLLFHFDREYEITVESKLQGKDVLMFHDQEEFHRKMSPKRIDKIVDYFRNEIPNRYESDDCKVDYFMVVRKFRVGDKEILLVTGSTNNNKYPFKRYFHLHPGDMWVSSSGKLGINFSEWDYTAEELLKP